jgi:hypothetical protein
MEFYAAHAEQRDQFEVLAFHDQTAKTFAELDTKLAPVIAKQWRGKSLPFPILLDATATTVRAYGIQGYPTLLLIDPDGRIVKGGNEATLAAKLRAAKDK